MIIFVDKNGNEATWVTGEPLPKLESKCVEVYADGPELHMIEQHLWSIVLDWNNGLTQHWYDADAQMIYKQSKDLI